MRTHFFAYRLPDGSSHISEQAENGSGRILCETTPFGVCDQIPLEDTNCQLCRDIFTTVSKFESRVRAMA
jgi:hypothetical protein